MIKANKEGILKMTRKNENTMQKVEKSELEQEAEEATVITLGEKLLDHQSWCSFTKYDDDSVELMESEVRRWNKGRGLGTVEELTTPVNIVNNLSLLY